MAGRERRVEEGCDSVSCKLWLGTGYGSRFMLK